ncbi:hypothetical protein Q0N12_10285 [Rossellomorea marisflavi]|uniref:hypothetical protein n=2 Tax=Rossellomorea marisflavi TaxID=189381 RepID=UPI001172DA36|nr:hypothetical protein [Rossellomorea marisflavi]WJV18108.1 hypothetical protein QU593_18540 [Rossellomorea marisflavi]
MMVIQNKKTLTYEFIGFKDEQAYGEIYVTNDDSKTSIFRGTGLKRVMRDAKKGSCRR